MTNTVAHENRKRSALLMAVYTFLLALGAALPLAASYQPGLRAAEKEGEIECGGYARAVQAEEAEDAQAADCPRDRRRTVRAAASVGSSETAPAVTCGDASPAPETIPRPPPAPEQS